MDAAKSTTALPRRYSPRHGMSYTAEYYCWQAMKKRCYKITNKEYRNYGGRGITVCERWLSDFNNFLADMGKRPTSKHSIERRENNGNYEPDNCYWATKIEQSANRRINRFLTFRGRTMTMAAWSRELGLGIRGNIIRQRLNKGWSIERALTTPRLGKDRRPV